MNPKNNKILVIGAAGFIGFHLSRRLLSLKKQVLGIDNLNNYYDPKIKTQRLTILKKNKNFQFIKLDICKKLNFNKLKKYKFDTVYHLAAQAGVRYSFYNPEAYINSNIVGLFNVLKFCQEKTITKIVYASSSSVYGNQKIFPVQENQILSPTSLYGITKKNNEEMAEYFSANYKMKIIGLRFFTVFGEYGRPDMFLIKYLNAFKHKKFFYLNNFGKHVRDFTYVGDVVKIITSLKFTKSHQLFNICSNNPVKLNYVISLFKKYKIIPKIKKVKFQMGDVLKTHGCNQKILRHTNTKRMTAFNLALQKLILWFRSN